MKEILTLMAQYNKVTNQELFALLEGIESEKLVADTGGYFGSIIGLLNHILLADLGWFTAYRSSAVELQMLDSPVLDFTHPGWAKNLYNDLQSIKDHQVKADELFIQLVKDTPEEVLAADITLERSGGRKNTGCFGKLLMHLLNHHTHHRGAISQTLDEWGVENDYSNIIKLLFS